MLYEVITVIAATQLDDIALVVLHHLFALDHIGVAQTHLAAADQALVLFVGLLAEVGLIDIDLPAEGDLPLAHGLILRVV